MADVICAGNAVYSKSTRTHVSGSSCAFSCSRLRLSRTPGSKTDANFLILAHYRYVYIVQCAGVLHVDCRSCVVNDDIARWGHCIGEHAFTHVAARSIRHTWRFSLLSSSSCTSCACSPVPADPCNCAVLSYGLTVPNTGTARTSRASSPPNPASCKVCLQVAGLLL